MLFIVFLKDDLIIEQKIILEIFTCLRELSFQRNLIYSSNYIQVTSSFSKCALRT